ncbi:hypothetical protein EDD16DRAFT_1536124 [Pisolithus croceorrhizus]|nr:hypothetical protein EDD16DRAFT_1536124 [Pisolithus croceorrhizus]
MDSSAAALSIGCSVLAVGLAPDICRDSWHVNFSRRRYYKPSPRENNNSTSVATEASQSVRTISQSCRGFSLTHSSTVSSSQRTYRTHGA